MMYEELSRLLAGDLDPASEAALRARIAADPTLARAWADMSALPDLLGGMSFDAPPPALAARLSAQIDEDALDPLEHELDRADPRDSADDTLDPDVTAARHPARARALARAPASASGREAFLDQLLASARTSAPPLVSIAAPIRSPVQSRPVPSRSPAVATPGRGRQVGVTAFIAAMALAAG
ncbi:MAG: hypothetical protein Q8P41_14655, partial [Pseudomonadota bacterium]|nr:hypothetical protein [Pseudomonadota bacterium]